MDNVIKRIEIDLYSPTSYEIIKAQQGDNHSRLIEFSLYNQGNPYIIPDTISIKMEGHRGDNSSFIRDDNCSVSNNIITVALDSDILYETGTVEAKIVLYDWSNDSILSTIPFKIHVQKNPCDKNKVEKEKRSLIDWLITNFEKLKISFNEHINNTLNPHAVTKTQVGLGNVDNTADPDKPVSIAQQIALDKKANIESPTLTGIPKAPTSSVNNNSTQIATTAFSQSIISNHNTSASAHEDIRNLILILTTKLNTLADSDDTTLDQLSEIVAYIKSNRTLIENVTTNKVNVSDIINNLTSIESNKPLSAKQGKILNDLIAALTDIVNNKVDKIEGKVLSTNDYTDEEKNKVANIFTGTVTGVKGNTETIYRKGNVNLTAENIGALSTPTSLKGSLDDCKNPGFYYAVGGNKITEKPQGVDSFGLLVTREGNLNRGQLLFSSRKEIGTYARRWDSDSNVWTEWVQLVDSDGNAVSATKALQDGNGKNIAQTYQTKIGDSKDNTVTFSSADNATPAAWTNVPVMASGEKHSSLLNKISTMFKNIRYLYKMLGTTDISQVGNGTVTGALSSLSANSLKCKVVSSPVTGIAAGSYKEIQFDTGLSGDHTLMAAVPVLNQHSYLQTETKLISATVYSVTFRFNNNGNAAITSGALSAVLLYL